MIGVGWTRRVPLWRQKRERKEPADAAAAAGSSLSSGEERLAARRRCCVGLVTHAKHWAHAEDALLQLPGEVQYAARHYTFTQCFHLIHSERCFLVVCMTESCS